jgi:hypothetical protein
MYYVVRVKYLKDGTEKRSELMAYDTKQEALSKFHTNMGTDMADESLAGSFCSVLNNMGFLVTSDNWHIEEPEPEPNEE